MKHLLCGYVEQRELRNVTAADASKLDVINVAFVYCMDAEIAVKNEADFAELDRIRSYNSNLKILFSVGGWGAGGFSPMAATAENREKFAKSCVETVEKYNLDGIDIDWEYPTLDWAGIEASPDDKQNYTAMLEAVRAAFDRVNPALLLTVAVGCDRYFIAATEMDRVAALCDYVSIMTYDMRGCGDRVTGHHSNLFPTSCGDPRRAVRSVTHSVEIYHAAGVPLEKIVIGAAFYSRMWKNVQSESDGLCAPADPGNYGPGYGELHESYIGKNGFVRYFDEAAQAPYLFDGSTFISYDDPQSIAAKCKYLKVTGLLGIMYWEHRCDPTRTLLSAMYEAMKEE